MGYWNDHCFCCERELFDEPTYFTCEFDAYICEKCYNDIMSRDTHDPEEEIIYNEFMQSHRQKVLEASSAIGDSVSASAAAPQQAFYLHVDGPAQEFETIFRMNDIEVDKDLFYESIRYDAEEEFEDSMDFIAAETLGIVNIQHFIQYLHGKGFIDDLENEYISNIYDQAYMNGGIEVNNNKYETIVRGKNV